MSKKIIIPIPDTKAGITSTILEKLPWLKAAVESTPTRFLEVVALELQEVSNPNKEERNKLYSRAIDDLLTVGKDKGYLPVGADALPALVAKYEELFESGEIGTCRLLVLEQTTVGEGEEARVHDSMHYLILNGSEIKEITDEKGSGSRYRPDMMVLVEVANPSETPETRTESLKGSTATFDSGDEDVVPSGDVNVPEDQS